MMKNNNSTQLKTIGLFNDSFPPIMDGVAVSTQNLAYWIHQQHQPVCVVTPNVPHHQYTEPYPVITFPSLPFVFRKPYRLGLPDFDPHFLHELHKIPFALLHAHCPFTTGLLAMKLAHDKQIPIIATFHSKLREDFERVFHSKVIANLLIKEVVRFYEKADEVWIPQASVEDTIREYGYKGRLTVVENGSDFPALSSAEEIKAKARVEMQISTSENILLYVGQHIWEKNTRMIIEALKLMSNTSFRMYFIGTGYAAQEMKDMVTAAGLSDKVEFKGVIADRDVLRNYYGAADLFLFPSIYDNAPLVIREAAAFHTPSILTKGSTAAGVITDNVNGFLTENSPEALAIKISQLIADKRLLSSVGKQASATLARSWEDIATEVLDRYKQLIIRKSK